MKHILTAVCMVISILSCSQQTPEVHKVNHDKKQNNAQQAQVKFANSVDPICNMKTTPSMKDTVMYKGKTYGFCSTYCKQEFKKDPKKYVK